MSGALILVVEDNERNAKLLRDVLEHRGYRVLVGETGEEGVALAREHLPALVLMDIQLPGISGIEAFELLRADAATRDIPVVAVTASAMHEERARIASAGFAGYQPKPIRVMEFLQAVEALHDAGRADGERGVSRTHRILVVDDTPLNVKLLADLLAVSGYEVDTAGSGEEGLAKVVSFGPDLLLLDVVMPGMSGYEVCQRLREVPETEGLPVVLVTALDPEEERVKGLEAGADDFLSKPVNRAELLARVKSLLRIKTLHERVQAQAAELAEWNRALEQRVAEQVGELERLARLRRFLSPQVADAVVSSGEEGLLASHRALIATVFCDLRGFTAFSETAEPEEAMEVLQAYHESMGLLIHDHGGTIDHRAGDGIMVIFNDPLPCDDPAGEAVRMALRMRERMDELTGGWRKLGHRLGFGVGISLGYATVGVVGYEGRYDYTANGSSVNLAARLADEAGDGQILISQRANTALDSALRTEPVGELVLKGFHEPVTAFAVLRCDGSGDATGTAGR